MKPAAGAADAKSETGAPGQAARRAAAMLIAGVLDQRRSLADQLGEDAILRGLASSERARAQSLATATLRHLGRVDAVLASFLDKPPPPVARHALRLAVCEMMLDEVPPHAAVDGAVRLVRAHPRLDRLSGLVNAVARRVAREGRALWDASPQAPLPDWLAGPLREELGAEVLAEIGRAHARGAPPPLDLTLRAPDAAAAWADRLDAQILPTGGLRIGRRVQVSALPGYHEGAWWVQDAAASVPARLLGDLRGKRVLDLCAAPGGKTLQLAAAGADVVALDLSDRRLGRLRANLARTGLAAEVVVADARVWEPEAGFDAVLVDAPCTASGTIRRHPDLPHVRHAAEIPKLVALQAELLRRAWRWVAPGGRMVYCTCSLLQAEGSKQIAAFCREHPQARQIRPDPARLAIAPLWLDAEGGLRLRPDFWPETGGMDGFYAALLEKPGIAT